MKAIVYVAAAALCAGTASAQRIPPIEPVPDTAASHAQLMHVHDQLTSQRSVLRARAYAHNARCSTVRANTTLEASCMVEQRRFEADRDRHFSAVDTYNRAVKGQVPVIDVLVPWIASDGDATLWSRFVQLFDTPRLQVISDRFRDLLLPHPETRLQLAEVLSAWMDGRVRSETELLDMDFAGKAQLEAARQRAIEDVRAEATRLRQRRKQAEAEQQDEIARVLEQDRFFVQYLVEEVIKK